MDSDLEDIAKRKELALEKIEQTKKTSEEIEHTDEERPHKGEGGTQSKRIETLPEKELHESEEETSEDIQRNTKSESTDTEAETVSDSTKEDLTPYKDDGLQEIHRKDTPAEADKLEHESKHDFSEPLEKEQSEVVESHETRNPVRTEEEYEHLRERHPYVEDMSRWFEIEKRKDLYMHVKEVQRKGEIPDMTLREWARELDTSYSTLRSYLEDVKQPEAFDILDRNEEARRLHESKLAPEAFEHRVDPSDVYQHFKHSKEHSPEDLAAAIKKMHSLSEHDSRMQWAELRPYHTGGPKWMRGIAKSIEQNREEVEEELNKRMGLDDDSDERMRLGLIDSKLYMRRQDTNEYNWMNMYRNELVYFRSLEEKKALVEEARNRLGIQGTRRLSQLIDQITDKEQKNQSSNPNYDTKDTVKHLRGYSLGMMLDTNNQCIQDIKPMINGVGKKTHEQYGIRNPQFPREKEKIDLMYASMLGAGLSDGHVEKSNDGFVYTESNRKRVEIFNKQVDQFGEVYRHEQVLENGVIRTRYSSTFGRLLENRGLVAGDKAIQNKGVHESVLNGNSEVKQKYLAPMWAQDGNFNIDSDGRARFQWDRGVVLRDPSKEQTYNHESLITDRHAELIKNHGDRKESEGFGTTYEIIKGKLEDLEDSPDLETARTTTELLRAICDNPSYLMNDERKMLEDLGIETKPYLRGVYYYEGTGRVSVLYHATTKTKDDAMCVALQCPPEDVDKRHKVEEWVRSEPARLARVKEELEKSKKGETKDEP